MNWQEPAIKQQERLFLVSKIEAFECTPRPNQTSGKKSIEADSPRHFGEAELTVTIKIKHPQLCRTDNNSEKHTHTNAHSKKKHPLRE